MYAKRFCEDGNSRFRLGGAASHEEVKGGDLPLAYFFQSLGEMGHFFGFWFISAKNPAGVPGAQLLQG